MSAETTGCRRHLRPGCARRRRRRGGALLAPTLSLGLLLGAAVQTAAQDAAAQSAGPEAIAATAGWTDAWLRGDTAISLELSRWPAAGEGRIALLLDGGQGAVDVTDLFRSSGRTLIYRPELAPLPAGSSQLLVYTVDASGEWLEVAQLPLRVLTRSGLESKSWTPRLDLQSEGLIDSGGDADPNAETGLRDASGQFDLQGQLERGGWSLRMGANIVGSTETERALRFGEKGEDAPEVDLSSYSLRLEKGRRAFELGHLVYGRHSLLVSGASGRGLALSLPLGRAAEISAGTLSATSIVGWDNLVGLSESRHRLIAGSLGVEALPKRPGALRFGLSYLDGSKLPIAGFNQGVVDDAEESRGLGLSVAARAVSDRLRLNASWAESEFENPGDPTLAQGTGLVEVAAETREARTADLAFDLLRDKALGERFTTGWTVELRHEETDPQYRSLGALGVAADRRWNQLALQGTVGPMALQIATSEARDNLDDIPSVLTTRTDRDTVNLTVPLADLPQQRQPWLPMMSLAVDRTHQRGDGVPLNSGFNASHVPDQVSDNANLGLDWSGARWRVGYRINRSEQDNRQPGRELVDLEARAQEANLWVSAHARFDIGLALALERSERLDSREEDETLRYGVDLAWRPTDRMTAGVRVSWSDGEVDSPAGRAESESFSGDGEWTWRFERRRSERHGFGGQLFLRLSSQAFESVDPRFSLFEDRDSWTLRAGINLSLF